MTSPGGEAPGRAASAPTAETIRLARRGDPAAREIIARRALTLALRTARVVTRADEEGDDIAQEVGAVVLRQLPRAPKPALFDYWVHRITVRVALRHLSDRRAVWRQEVPFSDQALEVSDASAEIAVPSPPAPKLVAAVAGLSPRERLAIALRYVHDLTEAEVADALDCRPGTAAAILSRARASLRADLAAGGIESRSELEAGR